MTLIIHAPNAHQGGGRTLLLSVLEVAGNLPCIAILDDRLELPPQSPPSLTVLRVRPTLAGRFIGEWRLRCLASPEHTILCFGNLPPLFNITGRVRVLLQNRYLLARYDLSEFPLRTRLRLLIERFWFRFRQSSRMKIIVQTPSMARELENELGILAQTIPFRPPSANCDLAKTPRRFDFIYVATGEPHKNHRCLVEAWQLLASEGIYPSLCLTLDRERDHLLLEWIESQTRGKSLRIENVGILPQTELAQYYRMSAALIYPSTMESFGLPLLEAAEAGLSIIASELDYVRDVSVPVQTFDPHSATSIARAVRRYLDAAEPIVQPLTPAAFLDAVSASD